MVIKLTSSLIHSYTNDSTLQGAPSLANIRNNITSSITLDLETLETWDSQNLFSFNVNKTQCCIISSLENKIFSNILFGSNTLKMGDSLSDVHIGRHSRI